VGPLGIPEMIFIFLLALLIFGPRKLPELGRTIGKALAEFRRASTELRHTVEDEMRNLEDEAREFERKAVANDSPLAAAPPPTDSNSASPQAEESPRYEENPADGEPKPL
jgi:sec-independent protein translocase protein TatA